MLEGDELDVNNHLPLKVQQKLKTPSLKLKKPKLNLSSPATNLNRKLKTNRIPSIQTGTDSSKSGLGPKPPKPKRLK